MTATENALALLQSAVYIRFFLRKTRYSLGEVRTWFDVRDAEKSCSPLNQNRTESNQDWSQPDKYVMVGALGDHPAIREIR